MVKQVLMCIARGYMYWTNKQYGELCCREMDGDEKGVVDRK